MSLTAGSARHFSTHPWALLYTLRQHHFLLRQLIRRDVASRYRGSLAGMLWSLLLPCIMLGVYIFVFGYVFTPARPVSVAATVHFAFSLFSGRFLHGLVGECLARAPGAVLSQPSYVKKVVFPIELLPLSVVGTALEQMGIGAAVLLLALAVTQGVPPTAWLLPLALLPLLAFVIGVAFVLSALTVYLRDLAQMTGFVATFLLFLSPVFYTLDNAPAQWKHWLLFNPVTVPIEVTRSLLLKGEFYDPILWALHAIASLLALWSGWWVVQRARKGFADVI